MFSLMQKTKRFILKTQGASSIEYALLASLIAATVVAAVTVLGTQTLAAFCSFLINFVGSC